MSTAENLRTRKVWSILLLVIVVGVVAASCSSRDARVEPVNSQSMVGTHAVAERSAPGLPDDWEQGAGSGVTYEAAAGESVGYADAIGGAGVPPLDTNVVRDGRVDLRIAEGTFDARGSEIRAIATELGGYVSSGESHIEGYGEDRYAVGWFTLRIPSDRFDDAVSRVEGLGERSSSSLSSQEVSDQYVDLNGRLKYWRQQEVFYNGLLAQAQDVTDLVAIQVQMQEVLLNIEQIEGQLQYLDGRTSFGTLTVGLTEAPDTVVSVVENDPGPIAEAFDQAGEVLLATVAFLIVTVAVVIPIGILALMVWLILRLFLPRRKDRPAEG